MRDDKVSVVMVCYNEGVLLQRAIDSIDAQTDRDFELVVVKNPSPCAETLRICRALEQRANTKVVYPATNEGNAAGRNIGFRAASGSIFIQCDGDDVLPPQVVATVRATFARYPEADYVFGDYLLHNVDTGESKVVDCSLATDGQGWLDGRQFARSVMFHGSSPCRRSTWQRVGGYRGSMYGWQDVDFWMSVIASGARGRYVQATLYEWHRRGTGVNSRTPPHRIWDVTLRNRQFQRKFGDWHVTCEAFLDHVIEDYAALEARRLMRRSAWRLFPLPLSLLGLYARACLKCCLPVRSVTAIIGAKERRASGGRHGK